MKQKDILFLAFSSVIVVFAWIIFTILHNSLASTINDTVSAQIAPIPGSFDTATINLLKKRQQITGDFSATGSAAPTLAPTIQPTIIPTLPIGSQSAKLTPTFSPTPTATSGGSKQ